MQVWNIFNYFVYINVKANNIYIRVVRFVFYTDIEPQLR